MVVFRYFSAIRVDRNSFNYSQIIILLKFIHHSTLNHCPVWSMVFLAHTFTLFFLPHLTSFLSDKKKPLFFPHFNCICNACLCFFTLLFLPYLFPFYFSISLLYGGLLSCGLMCLFKENLSFPVFLRCAVRFSNQVLWWLSLKRCYHQLPQQSMRKKGIPPGNHVLTFTLLAFYHVSHGVEQNLWR